MPIAYSNRPCAAAPVFSEFLVSREWTATSESPIAKYSDKDFSGGAASSVLSNEMSGIKRLVKKKELDIYMLFSNRRMSGLVEGPIMSRIKKETGANVVELFGIERMDLILKRHPKALTTFGKLNLPLLVTPDDLCEVILAISQNTGDFEEAFRPDELERTSFADKNTDNGLSLELAEIIRKKFMPKFGDVKRFLAKPGNEKIVERYESAADDFQEQLTVHRAEYETFDDALIRLTSLLFARDGDLASRKKLMRLVIYYMYWNCDIGTKEDEDAQAE